MRKWMEMMIQKRWKPKLRISLVETVQFKEYEAALPGCKP